MFGVWQSFTMFAGVQRSVRMCDDAGPRSDWLIVARVRKRERGTDAEITSERILPVFLAVNVMIALNAPFSAFSAADAGV